MKDIKTRDLIDFARRTPSTQCKGCLAANDDIGGYTLSELIYELCDRLEQYDKAIDRVAHEIVDSSDECPKGCLCNLQSTCVENLKEWLLRGDAE